jgi:hypothetical protein
MCVSVLYTTVLIKIKYYIYKLKTLVYIQADEAASTGTIINTIMKPDETEQIPSWEEVDALERSFFNRLKSCGHSCYYSQESFPSHVIWCGQKNCPGDASGPNRDSYTPVYDEVPEVLSPQ